MKISFLISRALWIGAALTILLAVSGGLWGILNAVRDHAGAAGARGVFLVVAVCWLLNFVALVVLTAIAHLKSTDGRDAGTSEKSESS